MFNLTLNRLSWRLSWTYSKYCYIWIKGATCSIYAKEDLPLLSILGKLMMYCYFDYYHISMTSCLPYLFNYRFLSFDFKCCTVLSIWTHRHVTIFSLTILPFSAAHPLLCNRLCSAQFFHLHRSRLHGCHTAHKRRIYNCCYCKTWWMWWLLFWRWILGRNF